MRHYYKSHGKHCYLRSYQSKCPRCNADVLFWECRHGSKVFFEYPPYGKLVRHFCRLQKGKYNLKNKFQIIVKKPKGLLEDGSPSCPVCGKLFKNFNNLHDHLENAKKNDINHVLFHDNKISFRENLRKEINKNLIHTKLDRQSEFGKINIKKREKN